MAAITISIRVLGEDAAQAGRYAQELSQAILDSSDRTTTATVKTEDAESMQFGETILVDLAAAALVHGAIEGIRHFLQKRRASLQISANGQAVEVKATTLAETNSIEPSLQKLEQIILESQGIIR